MADDESCYRKRNDRSQLRCLLRTPKTLSSDRRFRGPYSGSDGDRTHENPREETPFAQSPGLRMRPHPTPGPSRLGPQSQSFSRSYGSNLPTSLTYIIPSTRGYEPWRPAADMGTSTSGISAWPSPGFSWSDGKIPTTLEVRRSSLSIPYLAAKAFQGTR